MSYYNTAALEGCGYYNDAALNGCGYYNDAALNGCGITGGFIRPNTLYGKTGDFKKVKKHLREWGKKVFLNTHNLKSVAKILDAPSVKRFTQKQIFEGFGIAYAMYSGVTNILQKESDIEKALKWPENSTEFRHANPLNISKKKIERLVEDTHRYLLKQKPMYQRFVYKLVKAFAGKKQPEKFYRNLTGAKALRQLSKRRPFTIDPYLQMFTHYPGSDWSKVPAYWANRYPRNVGLVPLE